MMNLFYTNLNVIVFSIPNNASSEAICSEWQRRRPNITKKDLCLLAGAGEVALRLHNIPLAMIIYVANFLFPSNDKEKSKRSTPLEWLILTALYKQFDPDKLLNNAQGKKTLCERAVQDGELAVIITGERMARELTQSKHAQYLILVSSLGTDNPKTLVLLALLDALFGKYAQCKVNYNEQNQAYQTAYTETRQYYYFIKEYYSFWVKELKNKPEKIIEENELVRDYPLYFSNAKEILEECAPNKINASF